MSAARLLAWLLISCLSVSSSCCFSYSTFAQKYPFMFWWPGCSSPACPSAPAAASHTQPSHRNTHSCSGGLAAHLLPVRQLQLLLLIINLCTKITPYILSMSAARLLAWLLISCLSVSSSCCFSYSTFCTKIHKVLFFSRYNSLRPVQFRVGDP
jgi:hypothetical protein